MLGALGDPGVPGRWRWREWGEEDGVLRIDGVRGGAGENMPRRDGDFRSLGTSVLRATRARPIRHATRRQRSVREGDADDSSSAGTALSFASAVLAASTLPDPEGIHDVDQ